MPWLFPLQLALSWVLIVRILVFVPEHWWALVIAGWALLLQIPLYALNPAWRIFGPAVARVEGAAGRVALTFDDGPHPVHTRRTLDLLDAGGHKATFFVVGERVEQHPDVAAEIVARGHQLGSHGHRHRWQTILSPAEYWRDLGRAADRIEAAGCPNPRFHRSPFGLAPPPAQHPVSVAGLRFAAWSVRPRDAVSRDSEVVARRVLDEVREGDVVLMHDAPRLGGGPVDPDLEPAGVSALPAVLEGLERRGLRSVSLAELTGEPAWLRPEERERLKAPAPPRPLLHQLIHLTLAALFAGAALALFVLS